MSNDRLPADPSAAVTTETLPKWQPIILSAAPGEPFAAASAWLYEPSCGVRLGSFGRFADGVAFGNVSGMNGCFVRDWGATHWQPAIIPAPPEGKR